MPKVSEYFDFDGDEYKIKIKSISNEELKESIYKKRFRGNAATFSCGANMGLALAVGGATIIPGLISARTADIEDKKLHLLEKEWESRGQPELPVRIIKDIAVPCLVGATTLAVDAALLGAGGLHMVHSGVEDLASGTVANGTASGIHVLPSGAAADFLYSVEEGAKQVLQQIVHPMSHQICEYAPFDPTSLVGEGVGIECTKTGIVSAIKKIGGTFAE